MKILPFEMMIYAGRCGQHVLDSGFTERRQWVAAQQRLAFARGIRQLDQFQMLALDLLHRIGAAVKDPSDSVVTEAASRPHASWQVRLQWAVGVSRAHTQFSP